jgi:hypothetical protein
MAVSVFGIAILSSLLSACNHGLFELPPYVPPCGCEHPGLADLTEDELLALLDASVEKGTYEYRYLKKEIKKGRDPEEFLGHTRYDLGYADAEIWTVPAQPLEQCPFEIRWRICYHWEPCRIPAGSDVLTLLPLETGRFVETVRVYNPEFFLEGWVTQEFERESLGLGECSEGVLFHPGAKASDQWTVDIQWSSTATVPECWVVGDEPQDVGENDFRALQFDVICPCGNHELLDLAVGSPPIFDATDDEVAWAVSLLWQPCDDHPAEVRGFQETLEVRSEDGTVVHSSTDAHSVLTGDSLDRSWSAAALDSGKEYLFSVVLQLDGGDCDCADTDLSANNRATLKFVK